MAQIKVAPTSISYVNLNAGLDMPPAVREIQVWQVQPGDKVRYTADALTYVDGPVFSQPLSHSETIDTALGPWPILVREV